MSGGPSSVETDQLQGTIGAEGGELVGASGTPMAGVHLVVPRDRIHSSTGIILRTPVSVLFVIPWGRHWIIGTTDTDWTLSKAHPAASRADIDYVLDQVNRPTASRRRMEARRCSPPTPPTSLCSSFSVYSGT